jgi:hypothetical protein
MNMMDESTSEYISSLLRDRLSCLEDNLGDDFDEELQEGWKAEKIECELALKAMGE